MYNLSYFKDNDPKAVFEFVRRNPFAFIAGCGADGMPVATQIPVFLEEREGRLYLSGHMMRNTDHHKAFEQNPAALCVFTGPHTYVSATWYSDPVQASTWNYMSVHMKGRLQFLDEKQLIDVLQKTSLYFEGGDEASSTVYANLPASYTSKLVKAIVAFEVEVQHIDHVFKLSQNRDRQSFGRIIEKLEEGDAGAKGVAEEMRKREEGLYGSGS